MKQLTSFINYVVVTFLVSITNIYAQDLTWISVNNGLTQQNFRSVVVTPNNFIFAGSDSGVFRTTDLGGSWTSVKNGHTSDYVNSLYASNTGKIYSACQDGKVYRSTDNGLNWSQINSGLGNLPAYFITVNSLGYIFIGSSPTGVYRSTDDGSTWQQINNGFQFSEVFINCLITADSDVLMAGTGNDGLYRSTDNGDNWIQAYPSEAFLYLGRNSLNNDIFGCVTTGILKSTDNGLTWNYANSGLTSTYVNGVAFNYLNETFAATYGGGVFKSTDGGNFWNAQNSGLMPTNVWSLAVTSNGYLFAGSSTDGIYRTQNSTTPVEDEETLTPNIFYLEQNYPNPFNPSTKIKFTIPNVSLSLSSRAEPRDEGFRAQLKVYDILGNEVATLVNEVKPAGSYEIKFNSHNLTSGVYFYQLRAGDFISTKKMILLQ